MFQGLRAWFSKSADDKLRQMWRDNGGTITSLQTAEFIFSSDNTCHDTESLFASEEYMNEHLALFHSSYVSDCVRAGSREKVILGKYFLPPPDIAQLVKKQMTFCWDTQPTSSTTTAQISPDKRSVTESSSSVSLKQQHNKSARSSHACSSPRGVQRPQGSSAKDSTSSPKGQTAKKSSDGNIKSTKGAKSQISVQETPKERSSVCRKRRTESPSSLHLSPSKNLRNRSSPSLQQSVKVRKQDAAENSHRTGPSCEQSRLGKQTIVDGAPARTVKVAADVHITGISLNSDSEEQEQATQIAESRNNNVHQICTTSDNPESYAEEMDDSELWSEGTEVVDIKDLPKGTGILEDFIPGKDGCKVYIRK